MVRGECERHGKIIQTEGKFPPPKKNNNISIVNYVICFKSPNNSLLQRCRLHQSPEANCGLAGRSNSAGWAEHSRALARVRAFRHWAFREDPSCKVVGRYIVVAVVVAPSVGDQLECRWASGCPPGEVAEKEVRYFHRSRGAAGPWSCWVSSCR